MDYALAQSSISSPIYIAILVSAAFVLGVWVGRSASRSAIAGNPVRDRRPANEPDPLDACAADVEAEAAHVNARLVAMLDESDAKGREWEQNDDLLQRLEGYEGDHFDRFVQRIRKQEVRISKDNERYIRQRLRQQREDLEHDAWRKTLSPEQRDALALEARDIRRNYRPRALAPLPYTADAHGRERESRRGDRAHDAVVPAVAVANASHVAIRGSEDTDPEDARSEPWEPFITGTENDTATTYRVDGFASDLET